MLKILDSSGEVVGILEDEDSSPEMKKDVEAAVKRSQDKMEEGEEDATVRGVEEDRSECSETETGT
jgi:hypothetical protein